jgi:hypothetical protein
VVLTALALMLGLVVHGMQTSSASAGMMPPTAAGIGSMGDCDGCGDDGSGVLACSAMLSCTNMAAVLPLQLDRVATHAAELFIPLSTMARDLTAPPDPDPPRSRDLG